MISLIENNHQRIEALCRNFNVARLEIFGSAATGGFDSRKSDLDFLVEFKPLEPGALANAYFGLLSGIQQLFGRDVDLVTPKAIRNPYFLRGVNETRRMLYAA